MQRRPLHTCAAQLHAIGGMTVPHRTLDGAHLITRYTRKVATPWCAWLKVATPRCSAAAEGCKHRTAQVFMERAGQHRTWQAVRTAETCSARCDGGPLPAPTIHSCPRCPLLPNPPGTGPGGESCWTRPGGGSCPPPPHPRPDPFPRPSPSSSVLAVQVPFASTPSHPKATSCVKAHR